jgi:hypothetical protein
MANLSTPVKTHIPKDSLLFEKIIPALLIFFSLLTVLLILFAAGVLLGLIKF